MMKLVTFIFIIFLFVGNVLADTVTIKKTKTNIEDVKTTATSPTETTIEAKDGTKQVLKTSQITIVPSAVTWGEIKPEEKPGFFKKLFSSSPAPVQQETTVSQGTEKKEEAPKSFLERRFPEMAMGGMVLLYFLLP